MHFVIMLSCRQCSENDRWLSLFRTSRPIVEKSCCWVLQQSNTVNEKSWACIRMTHTNTRQGQTKPSCSLLRFSPSIHWISVQGGLESFHIYQSDRSCPWVSLNKQINYMQLIQIVSWSLVLSYCKYRWLVTKWYVPSSSPQFFCFHLSALLKIADGPLSQNLFLLSINFNLLFFFVFWDTFSLLLGNRATMLAIVTPQRCVTGGTSMCQNHV